MEYREHLDRLQMSLFSTLYHKAGGYLIVPTAVFSNLKNTEWGKLENFEYAMKTIEDIYYREANTTLESTNDIGPDSIRADHRFDSGEAKPNDLMISSYEDFVLEVGEKLNLNFKKRFSYFDGKKRFKLIGGRS